MSPPLSIHQRLLHLLQSDPDQAASHLVSMGQDVHTISLDLDGNPDNQMYIGAGAASAWLAAGCADARPTALALEEYVLNNAPSGVPIFLERVTELAPHMGLVGLLAPCITRTLSAPNLAAAVRSDAGRDAAAQWADCTSPLVDASVWPLMWTTLISCQPDLAGRMLHIAHERRNGLFLERTVPLLSTAEASAFMVDVLSETNGRSSSRHLTAIWPLLISQVTLDSLVQADLYSSPGWHDALEASRPRQGYRPNLSNANLSNIMGVMRKALDLFPTAHVPPAWTELARLNPSMLSAIPELRVRLDRDAITGGCSAPTKSAPSLKM